MPVILATWEAEIRRVMVQDQPEQKVHETPSQSTAGYRGMHLSSQSTQESEMGQIIIPGHHGVRGKFARLHLNRKNWA
jgi:hypothetical protein